MIVYEPFWKTLEEKGITPYRLNKDYGISYSILHRLRKNENLSLCTVDRLCSILKCKATDIMIYVEDPRTQ